jgi:hypothetical protein
VDSELVLKMGMRRAGQYQAIYDTGSNSINRITPPGGAGWGHTAQAKGCYSDTRTNARTHITFTRTRTRISTHPHSHTHTRTHAFAHTHSHAHRLACPASVSTRATPQCCAWGTVRTICLLPLRGACTHACIHALSLHS